jgi:hypothetical protein
MIYLNILKIARNPKTAEKGIAPTAKPIPHHPSAIDMSISSICFSTSFQRNQKRGKQAETHHPLSGLTRGLSLAQDAINEAEALDDNEHTNSGSADGCDRSNRPGKISGNS